MEEERSADQGNCGEIGWAVKLLTATNDYLLRAVSRAGYRLRAALGHLE